MAVEVVKHKKLRAYCRACGADLKYKRKDVKTRQLDIYSYQEYIVCPNCGEEVHLRNVSMGKGDLL